VRTRDRLFLPDGPVARATVATPPAARLTITGLVQGVGFRPFVHRVALRHGITGWVRNSGGIVEVHAEGPAEAVDRFADALRTQAPVLARIEAIARDSAPSIGAAGFRIERSEDQAGQARIVSPDVATCDACLEELFDPTNRRHRHAFITCTDCGPRFTVIESLPYDRARTSMRVFEQCDACRAEYETPGDRRHHSETNSCPRCGPLLWFTADRNGAMQSVAGAAIESATALLEGGGILAIRGLGGFHLAVDASNEEAVLRLRRRKHREAKPLAVMVRDLAAARRLAAVSDAEGALLKSSARPIVLLASGQVGLAAAVAPGLAHVGVMLAYTPVHHLLLAGIERPLVMTSGNLSDEPIAMTNDEALERLAGIADGFLLHDREIVARYDDSVTRVIDGAPVFLRRARGYAPMPVELPVASPSPFLAVGPHLKNTFSLVDRRRAYVSQHIGDLENLETVAHFKDALARYQSLFRITPHFVVHDQHPGYLSTRLAGETGLPVAAAVQHHHAHIAAVMAEHGRTEPVIGVAYDGTGYGEDGATWGGEVLVADLAGFHRAAHLRYAPLPGGDAAARAPWRTALGYLWDVPEAANALERAVQGVPRHHVDLVRQQLARGLNAPRASSMGRLFDAAAAVLGIRKVSAYEGEAAMRLEAAAGKERGTNLPFCITRMPNGTSELDGAVILTALDARLRAGEPVTRLAAAFHDTIVHATSELVRHVAHDTGIGTVALGGGCIQNARLLSGLRRRLEHDGLTVLVPNRFSPNDGAISLGQAAVGAARLAGYATAVPGAANPQGG
jgi:hydrogenase maturation protein HypF